MKKKKKKLISIILIIMLTLLILYIFTGKSFALDLDDIIDGGEGLMDGLVGVLLLPAKFIICVLGGIIGLIMGFFTENGSITGLFTKGGLTLQDILFNKVDLLNVNFFDLSEGKSVATTIRNNVAIWYTSIRNIAAIVLAIIAIYVGIRMAISTVAEEKAKYKSMLVDWLTSLALLFLLQYIMIFTININNAFINVLSKSLGRADVDMTASFLDRAFKEISFTSGMACAIIYLLLQGITFVFLLSYIKRTITIGFLMIISPLVTVTYSIDKMGDGRAQALNNWLKEFVYTILIQPFHCVSYLALGTVALDLVNKNNGWTGGAGIANAVVAIVILVFIYNSEKIVRHIFHFENRSMGETIANAAIAGAVLTKIGGSNGGGQKAAVAGTKKNFGGSNNNDNNSQSSNAQSVRQNNSNSDNSNNGNNTRQSANREAQQERSSRQESSETSGEAENNGGRTNKSLSRLLYNATVAANSRALGAIALGTLGLSTGEEKAGIAGAIAGYSKGVGFSEANKTRILQHDLARAVKTYKNNPANAGISQADIVNNAIDFADGTKIANTQEEIALRDAMQQYQAQLIRNGLDGKKMIKQSKQTVKDIDNGLITEYSKAQRYVGNVRSAIGNIRTRDNNNISTQQESRNNSNIPTQQESRNNSNIPPQRESINNENTPPQENN